MKEPPFPTRSDIIHTWIELCHTDDGTPEHEAAFWSYEAFDRLTSNFPHEAFDMIIDVLQRDQSHAVTSATGMSLFVNLIGEHGNLIIDKLEQVAHESPVVTKSLEGIYNQGASSEVWSRINKLAYVIN